MYTFPFKDLLISLRILFEGLRTSFVVAVLELFACPHRHSGTGTDIYNITFDHIKSGIAYSIPRQLQLTLRAWPS